MLLGQILLRKKHISSSQLDQAIRLQLWTKNKLGELLLQQGFVAQEQLELALKEQYWRQHGYWVID